MQGDEKQTPERDAKPGPATWARTMRRIPAGQQLVAMRLRKIPSQLVLTGLLALAGLILFTPLVLDDLVYRSGYLLRPATDAVEISRPLVLSDQPRITILSGSLSVPRGFSGRPRTGEALAALVKGGNARLALAAPVFQVEFASKPGGDDRPGALAASGSPMLAALNDATFEKLTIRDGAIHVLTPNGPEIVFEDVNADVVVKRKTAMRIKGTLKYRGEVVTYDTTVGSRIERRGAMRMPVKAQIKANPVSAVLDGRLDWRGVPTLTATTAEVNITSVRALARWLGPAWPSGPGLKDFSASGGLEWSENTIAVHQGLFRMDDNEARGELQIDLNGARPAISGTLAASSFDLSPYLPVSAPEDAAASSLIARFKSARDLTLPLLGLVDADVRFSADKVRLADLDSERAAIGLNLHAGRLLIALADVALPGGGQARGEFTIEGWTTLPNYAVKGAIEHVEMGPLTVALTGNTLMSGRGDIDLNLSASGASGIDVVSKLGGSIGIDLPSGGTVACSVPSIAAAARALQLGGIDPCSTSTAIGPLKARGSLAHGMMLFDGIAAKSGEKTVQIGGAIDLVTWIMDLAASSVTPKAEGQAEIVRVNVRGRPDAPTLIVRAP